MRLISDETLALITIYQEAAGEPFTGKVGVAEIIRNRMRQKYMSDGTVAGTVLRAYQFSGWNTEAGKVRIRSVLLDSTDPLALQCQAAWAEAMLNSSDYVKGAVLYLNPDTVLKVAGRLPAWAADPADPTKLDMRRMTAQIERHAFFLKE